MTTLFAAERKPVSLPPSGAAVVLYALTGILTLSFAYGNFRNGHHSDRAWMQAIFGVIYLLCTALYLSRRRKERRLS